MASVLLFEAGFICHSLYLLLNSIMLSMYNTKVGNVVDIVICVCGSNMNTLLYKYEG